MVCKSWLQVRIETGETNLIEESAKRLAEIRGLTVTYTPEDGPPVIALDDVSLDVRPGDVVGIMGESGSGKSTLAASIVRLLPPGANYRKGSIRFEGRDLLEMGEHELRTLRGVCISLIPQDPAICLNPVIRVGEQIAEVIRAHGTMSRGERRTRVQDLLREVCFDDPERIYGAYPHQLSGGQRQRVVIAQAMACRPALVIADEPTSKLDPPVQADILALLSGLVHRYATAMLMITHDPAILAGVAGRVAVMYAGRIVEEGKTEDVFQKPLHPYTQGLLRLAMTDLGNPILTRAPFPSIAGEPPGLTRTEPGCRFEPRCPARMPVCAQRDPRASAGPDCHSVSCFLYGN